MRKTSIYSILILTTIICTLLFLNKGKSIGLNNKPLTQVIVKNEIEIKSKLKTNAAIKKTSKIEVKNNSNETSIFSDDPLIDKFIMMNKFRYCFKNYKIFTSKKYTPKQKKMFKEYYLFCDKTHKEHPEYRLKDNNWDNFSEMPQSNSYLGRLFSEKEFYKSSDYDIKRIIKEAKNISPDLLLSDQYIFMYEYVKTSEQMLIDILQSHLLDYNRIISDYAQNLYACRIGADCGKNSTLMLTHCRLNSNFCMDDYELLIKAKLSKGQQADVALAYKFYESFFNVD